MYDRYGREIDYLRFSVTDRCGLCCGYCKKDYNRFLPDNELLTDDEIIRITRIMAGLGIKHIRLTGGEPLDRAGIEVLARELVKTDGIHTTDMTTNGLKLAKYAPELAGSGLSGVNVSLDTLNENKYLRITGLTTEVVHTPETTQVENHGTHEKLQKNEYADKNEEPEKTGYVLEILRGIDAALGAGLKVKINTVLTQLNSDDVFDMIMLAKDRPADVRFIELMPLGGASSGQQVPLSGVKQNFLAGFPEARPVTQKRGNGPAVYYRIPGFKGCIGFISAITDKFCDSCNRIRVTASGGLKTCLCYGTQTDLKSFLRNGASDAGLKELVRSSIYEKPKEHCFETPECITEHMSMSGIGG
ncbi:MAG: radical SAM protein [Lachnospiraceae bacterium]|nr:radical SAM protein [Lachnospiraceae bacterium]